MLCGAVSLGLFAPCTRRMTVRRGGATGPFEAAAGGAGDSPEWLPVEALDSARDRSPLFNQNFEKYV